MKNVTGLQMACDIKLALFRAGYIVEVGELLRAFVTAQSGFSRKMEYAWCLDNDTLKVLEILRRRRVRPRDIHPTGQDFKNCFICSVCGYPDAYNEETAPGCPICDTPYVM